MIKVWDRYIMHVYDFRKL